MNKSFLRMLIVLTILSFCFVLTAQITVTGRVIGSDAPNGIAGARVNLTFEERQFNTQTGVDGSFTINNVEGNEEGIVYQLLITSAAYTAHRSDLRVQQANINLGNIRLNELAWAPQNVQIELIDALNVVEVEWEVPEASEGEWLSWSGQQAGDIGSAAAWDWVIAHRYTPIQYGELGVVAGMYITTVRFFPMHELPYTVRIYNGGSANPLNPGQLVYSQLLAADDVEPGQWNEVRLTRPVEIPLDSEMWVGVATTTTLVPEMLRPFGIDDGPAIVNYGDVFFFSNIWRSMATDFNVSRNFCIEAFAGFLGGDRSVPLNPLPPAEEEYAYTPPAIGIQDNIIPTVTTHYREPSRSRRISNRSNNPYYNRELVGYQIYRVEQMAMNNPEAWTYLGSVGANQLEFTDEDWDNAGDGLFYYAVRAVYTGEVYSGYSFSSTTANTPEFGGGDGSFIEPWIIRTAYHFNNVRNYVSVMNNDKHFIQVADFDISHIDNWAPIGPSIGDSFQGVYDGGGHLISGMRMQRLGVTYQGLFGYIEGGTIMNLGVTDVLMEVGGYSGVLVGQNNGKIENCFTTGYMASNGTGQGGIAGRGGVNCQIINSYSHTTTLGGSFHGSIIGHNWDVRQDRPSLVNCYAAGLKMPYTTIAPRGLVGYGRAAETVNSYWDSEATGQANDAYGGQPLTTAQMMQQANYVDWNFNTDWTMVEGFSYPKHQWDVTRMNIPGPTGLHAEGGNRIVDLTWNAAPGAPDGYRVFRDNALLNVDELLQNTAFRDTDLTNFQNYTYHVAAVYTLEEIQYESLKSRPVIAVPFGLDGEGTAGDPWHLSTVAHLDLIRTNWLGAGHADKHFILTAHINLGDIPNWDPIGTAANRFHGNFNGNGFEIQNLTRTASVSNFGFFGYTEGAVLENIHFPNVNVDCTGSSGTFIAHAYSTVIRNITIVGIRRMMNSPQGGIVGTTYGTTSIYRCMVNMSMTDLGSAGRAGGIVGTHGATGVISECFALVDMVSVGSNPPCAAGIVTSLNNGSLINSYAMGNIRSTNPQGTYGGLVGANSNRPISNSFAIVTIDTEGPGPIGGLVLSGAAGSVTGSFWNIELSGVLTSPGGGEPLTTAQMLNRDTFEGWSFDDDPQIWSIEQGSYPYLTWEGDNAPDHSFPPLLLPPSFLEGTGGNGVVNLTWTRPSITAPLGYNVYRNQNQLNVNLIQNEQYADNTAENYNSYVYHVTAVYGDEEESGPSNRISVAPHGYEGEGTMENPYLIGSAVQLNGIRYFKDAHFRQTADIDLGVAPWNEGAGWLPLADNANRFRGTYNGNGFTISDMNIDNGLAYQGLFGYVQGGTLRNITLEDVNLRFGQNSGALAGRTESTNISDVTVTGNIEATGTNVGGLIGYALSSANTINNCSVSGTMTSTTNYLGGLIGIGSITINDCWTNLEITTAGTHAGGLVGSAAATLRINRCAVLGNITSTSAAANLYLGGIMGRSVVSYIEDSYVTGNVISSAEGGRDYVGGLIGAKTQTCYTILRSYTTGNVTGRNYVGGLVGAIQNTNVGAATNIEDSYAMGTITGVDYVGGLIGSNNDKAVLRSYSIGRVFGDTNVGGLIGSGAGVTTNSYWNTESSGINVSPGGGLARDNRQMVYPYMEDTYVDWDFEDVWVADVSGMLNNGYPFLTYQYKEDLLPPSEIYATAGNRQINLFWETPDVRIPEGYNVYRDGVKINTSLIQDTTYQDSQLADEILYLYHIISVDGEEESGASDKIGYIAYNCVTGTTANNNFIAVPLEMVDSEGETLETLNDLGNYFRPTPAAAPLVNSVSFWVPQLQAWEGIAWDAVGQNWQGNPATPFPLEYGNAYMVHITENLTFYNVGKLTDPIQYNLVEGTTGNLNFIMIPLNKTELSTLNDLGNDIETADAVYFWVPETQAWNGIFYDGYLWQNNPPQPFSVRVGMPLMINITEPIIWPQEQSRSNSQGRRSINEGRSR